MRVVLNNVGFNYCCFGVISLLALLKVSLIDCFVVVIPVVQLACDLALVY